MTYERILLAHGGGGQLTGELVRDVILSGLGEAATGSLDDAVELIGGSRLAFTTDSYVVKPIFFPGGDLGRLAVCGTVNDLAMRGAEPVALSLAFIIEEGFLIADLKRLVASVREAALEAGVTIATGDTKVVERGSADGIFVNTAGVGRIPEGVELRLSGAREGDEIIVSGPVGNHAIAVLAHREGLSFETVVRSDVAPLVGQAKALVEKLGGNLHVLNDPTRGGLAGSLNTIAEASGVGIDIDEHSVPVEPAVAFAAEMLGLEVLNLANEGKLVAVVAVGTSGEALDVLYSRGAHPALIGRACKGAGVAVEGPGGGKRMLEMPYGEDAPRIC